MHQCALCNPKYGIQILQIAALSHMCTKNGLISIGMIIISFALRNITLLLLVQGAGRKAKRMVLQCINGMGSNPVEGRTKI